MVVKRTIFFITVLFYLGTVGAEVFRWTNEQGEVVYGDSPPNSTSTEAVPINDAKSGTRFATEQQIKQLEQSRPPSNKKPKAKKMDSHCRKYVSQLNKTEIYLEHTYNERDAQKAKDLRKLIARECRADTLVVKHDDSRCGRYRQDLAKIEVYLEHTPTERDQQKAKDLQKQIKRECR